MAAGLGGWRRGRAGIRGQAARCQLDEAQLAELERVLEAGPLAAGWTDQRWTLARVRDLVAGKFGVATPCRGSGTCCAAAAGPPRWAPAARSNGTTAPSRCGRRRPGPR